MQGRPPTAGPIGIFENCGRKPSSQMMFEIGPSAPSNEATPGVVAFLATLLAEQNVNIVEFISCWTETIMVVEKKDSLKTYEILSNMVG